MASLDARDPNRLAAEQARQNRSTAGQWDLFASHRRALERLLVPERPGSRLCVLGAGNCNDLDLAYLLDACAEVHLVDIDAAALERAATRQGVAGRPGLRLHAPVDLTAVAGELSAWGGLPPIPAALNACIRTVLDAPLPTPGGPFDLVLSPCVLSQTIDPVLRLLGPGHERRADVAAAWRLRHVRTMAGLLAPGGRGVLAIDLVSSAYRAELPQVPEEQLAAFMEACLESNAYFTGLSPGAVRRTIASVPGLTDARLTPPWRWHLGIRKSFLVYAAVFRKARP